MEKAKTNYKVRRDLDNELRNNFTNALKKPKFKALVKNLEISEALGMKYTSRLEDTVAELSNCETCEGLMFCKNKIEGHINFPNKTNDKLVFSYRECKYQKKHDENVAKEIMKKNSLNIGFKDIDIDDKKRLKVIKWLKDFYKNYDKNKKCKGLYLHGSFGSGKTFLITATLNELSKNRVSVRAVYFPELIRDLKGDFDTYADKMDYLMNVDILLLDDIGAEKVTEWSRDEVLGTTLQYRMENHLTTFFTSNLTLIELESHLSTGIGSDNKIKARRIIERIKQLTQDIDLISENRRK